MMELIRAQQIRIATKTQCDGFRLLGYRVREKGRKMSGRRPQ